MLELKKYDLPDFSIFESNKNEFKIWIPDRKYLILGASNTPEDSLIIKNVITDKIPVYKRPSGGQAVLISPQTIVISVLLIGNELTSKEIFGKINSLIMHSLMDLGIENLVARGISDIAIEEKKILGSSMYRKKEKFFYHAVLNISEHPETFERYLKHPSKEPEYRAKRSHKDFITSLLLCGYPFPITEIFSLLKRSFSSLAVDKK